MTERKGLFSTEDWVKFLKEQSHHTREYRYDLYEKVDVKTKLNILDAGCGTGVITADIASLTAGDVTGIDIDPEKLEHAKLFLSGTSVNLIQANVLQLPFKDETFDLVVFSVLLMHVRNQQRAVNEMARVTKEKGIVLATMESDHAGALYYPDSKVHPLFLEDLEEMGSDERMGRKLKYLFCKAGLKTEIGLSTHSFDAMNKSITEQRTEFLNRFWVAEKLFIKNGWTEQQIEDYKQEQITLIENGLNFHFLPVFYAIGKKE